MEIDPAQYVSLTLSNATVASGTVDAQGRARFALTATGSAGRAYTTTLKAGVTLSTADEYRLWCDIEPISGAAASTSAAGINFRRVSAATNSHRFGTAMGAGIALAPLNGKPIRGLSRIFKLDSGIIAEPSLAVYPGSVGNTAMIGRCALIRVKKG